MSGVRVTVSGGDFFRKYAFSAARDSVIVGLPRGGGQRAAGSVHIFTGMPLSQLMRGGIKINVAHFAMRKERTS